MPLLGKQLILPVFYLFTHFEACDFIITITKRNRSNVGRYKSGHLASLSQRDTRTTVKNHNRSTALERSIINFWGGGGVGRGAGCLN